MWVSKNAEVRKREFMDTAVRLFTEKGYDGTSLNDVIAAVGVTKGSFYYHFKSKEEIVDAIIQTLAEGVAQQAARACEPPGMAAPEKFCAIVESLQGYRLEERERYACLYGILRRDENAALSIRFQRAVECLVLPLMERLIAQGNDEGNFHAPDTARTARLILRISALYKSDLAASLESAGADTRRMLTDEFAYWQDVLERVLGAGPGSLPVAGRLMPAATQENGKER